MYCEAQLYQMCFFEQTISSSCNVFRGKSSRKSFYILEIGLIYLGNTTRYVLSFHGLNENVSGARCFIMVLCFFGIS